MLAGTFAQALKNRRNNETLKKVDGEKFYFFVSSSKSDKVLYYDMEKLYNELICNGKDLFVESSLENTVARTKFNV